MAREVGAAWNRYIWFCRCLVFYSWLEYQEQNFPSQCYCVRCDSAPVCYDFTLQEHVVCDNETTSERTKRDHYYDVKPLQLDH